MAQCMIKKLQIMSLSLLLMLKNSPKISYTEEGRGWLKQMSGVWCSL